MKQEDPDVPLPPYDKGGSEPIQQNPISRSSGGSVPPPGPGRERSAEEEEGGLEADDIEPGSPFGVGESQTRRGEDVVEEEGKEAGREERERTGAAQRPSGASGTRDSTSVDTNEKTDPRSPGQPAGN